MMLISALILLAPVPAVKSSLINVKGDNNLWTCTNGADAFCRCKPFLVSAAPATCAAAQSRCRETFCSPICLGMAWRPVISVDCARAPMWAGCADFAEELRSGAASAIVAQFQAFVCSRILGCCPADGENVRQLVDDSLYGEAFPRRALPMRTCSKYGSGQHASRCSACEAAVSVSLAVRPDMCVPKLGTGFGQRSDAASGNANQFAVEPESLTERCAFVQDAVSSMAERLVPALQDAVCACAGCCEADAVPSSAAARRRVCLFDLPLEDAWHGPLAFLGSGSDALLGSQRDSADEL